MSAPNSLVSELAAERRGQLEGAKAVLKLLIVIATSTVFVLCSWQHKLGLWFSIGAAVLTLPAISLGGCSSDWLPSRKARGPALKEAHSRRSGLKVLRDFKF
jgi:hypothetical protein